MMPPGSASSKAKGGVENPPGPTSPGSDSTSGQHHWPFWWGMAHRFEHNGFNVMPNCGEIHHGDTE